MALFYLNAFDLKKKKNLTTGEPTKLYVQCPKSETTLKIWEPKARNKQFKSFGIVQKFRIKES